MEPELSGEALPKRLDIDVCRSRDSALTLLRDEGDDAGLGTLTGEFSLFGQWYEINSYWEGRFIERIQPGSFKRTINNRSDQSPVRVLLEHGYDPQVGDKPLGVPAVLEERDTGPYAETPLLDTSYNRDLAPALAAGAYGQSFRFRVRADEWVEPEADGFDDSVPDKWKNLPQRSVTELQLIEFGPTVFPASPGTNDTTGVRSSTDSFYEQMARRDSGRYQDAVRSAQAARRAPEPTPAAPVADEDSSTRTEDPQVEEHAEAPDAQERAHADAPPTTPHSEADNTPSPSPERSSEMPPEQQTLTIEERTARQSEIRTRLTEIDTEHAGSELPEEARAEFTSLEEEYDGHAAAIADATRRQEAIAARAADVPGSNVPVRPAAGPAVVPSRNADIFDLGAIRQQARSVDDLPRLYRDNAMRAIEGARFPGAEDRSKAQAQVERLLDTVDDDQGTLARRILTTGSPAYMRAFGKAITQGAHGLTSEEQRALSLGTDTAGGFAVPFQLDPTVILTSDGVADPLRQIARVEQIVGKTWQGVTSAGVSVGRSAEAAESDDDAFAIAQPEVTATRVDAFVPFSVEIEADWARLQSEITKVLADAKMTEEADSFINGDGVTVEPEGLLTGTTEDVLPATAATFADADLYALEEALPERWLANASFLAHRSFYNAVRQLGADSDGGNLWVRLSDGLPPELIGYPARRQSELPAFNQAAVDGTVQAVFGDFKQFLIVDRIGMNIELVPHLVGANRRPTGQRGIYAYWRNASKVLVDGAFRRLVTDDGV
jgi:HK97 family phage major capsid protein/HK97 family phage prohead protease